MKIYRRIIVAGLGLMMVAGVTPANTAHAEGDALLECMLHLNNAVDALGTPQAGEIRSERNEIKSAFDQLRPQVIENGRQRDSLDYEKQKFDRAYRENADKLKQIDFEENVLTQEWENLNLKRRNNNADAMKHAEALAATDPENEAAVAAMAEWARRGNEIRDANLLEKSKLEERSEALKSRRAAIASDIVLLAQSLATRYKYRYVIDQEMTSLIRECSALTMRATALKLIVSVPGGRTEYESPDAVAKKVMNDLGENLAKEATNSLIGSKSGQHLFKSPKALRKIMKTPIARKYLVRFGVTLEVLPVALALTAADLFADAALAGASQREREVVKNIYLIGEYAHAMEQLIKQKGKHAKQTAEYEALVSELKRLQTDMPTGSWGFFGESLQNSAFLGNAFLGIASNYVSGKAGLSTVKSAKYVSNATHKYLGRGGSVFFQQAHGVGMTAVADTSIKASAQLAADAYSIHLQTPVQTPASIEMNAPTDNSGADSIFVPNE
ncbi:MAG: hypothetical protein ACRERV_08730 [Methylococcales bacterium]